MHRLTKDATLQLCNAVRPYMQEAVRVTAISLELKVG